MKIISGAGVIMKGVRKNNNLYHYLGRTVIGTVVATSTDDRESEEMKLWHMRLGHADNGGEYRSDPFEKICKDEGIVRHFTVRHTPQQNGVAERMNQTLLDKVRCMLSNVGLDRRFCAEAVAYACHLVNRLLSTAIDGKTPMEKWFGKPATDYDSLHVLDPRAKKAIFMGITLGIKETEQSDGTPKQVEFERVAIPVDETTNEDSLYQKEVQMKRRPGPKTSHSNMNQLHFASQKEPLESLLVLLIWWLVHLQLQLMTFLSLIMKQSKV
ncbi:UNVERIFIED_CONTAM: Retrovirus-related Pol polyprotein from transposon TNT 1-94 [Sesamum latifolium]|uniref:Retrovirus-related Pol polyprotein from transposon TNT 1-94 n=1 Tax=Sesamum latifolium TaxID=2727402 RepID=A0AAW2U4R9_9LAMI